MVLWIHNAWAAQVKALLIHIRGYLVMALVVYYREHSSAAAKGFEILRDCLVFAAPLAAPPLDLRRNMLGMAFGMASIWLSAEEELDWGHDSRLC